MENKVPRVNRFIVNLATWASSQEGIQAVALLGSYARGVATTSSDVDLVTICRQSNLYLEHKQWVSQFGDIMEQQVESYGKVTSIRVWYFDNLEVEYGITGEDWISLPLDAGTRQVIQDGMEVVFERDASLSLVGDQVSEKT